MESRVESILKTIFKITAKTINRNNNQIDHIKTKLKKNCAIFLVNMRDQNHSK